MNPKDELTEEELKVVDEIIKEEESKNSEKQVSNETKEKTESSEIKQEENSIDSKEEKKSFLEVYKRYTFLISMAIAAIYIAVSYVLGEHDILLFREIGIVVYLIVAIGFFISVLRILLKIQNKIVKVFLGILHVGFWMFVSFVAYILLALSLCSYKDLTFYHDKTYVEEFGFFGSSSYHEVINPLMYKQDRVDEGLEDSIDTYGY